MKVILYNGKIRVSDNRFEEAILIEDGLIKKLGKNQDILKERDENTQEYDLGGRLALPGFNDSHMHFLNVGYNFSQIDLGETKSIDEAIELCREYIQKNKIQKGRWIQCYGWNDDNWKDKRHLCRYDLDKISTEHPILASRVCTHVASVNSKALEVLGIKKGTPQPEVGEFLVDEEGQPTGVLYEMLPQIGKSLSEPTVEEIKEMLIRVGNAAAAKGLTSVQSDDMESVPGNNFKNILTAFKELADSDELPVRVYEQCRLADREAYKRFKDAGYRTGMGNDVFRLGPLKAFCDGSLGARTAWLIDDYSDDPGNRGLRIYDDPKELNDLVQMAHDDGMSVAIHCIGDAAAEQAVSAIENAMKNNPNMKNRHGIVHAQILNEDLIERIQKSNIIAYIQPIFLEYDLTIAESRVGKERIENSYAFRKMYDKGIKIPFGTDSPVEDFAPMKNLYCAVTGKDFNDNPEGGWHPEKLLSLSEAMECYTEHSAYASFEEDKKGVIALGYFADITVLETDIFQIKPEAIKDVEVFMTMMAGKVRYIKK